MNDSHLLSIIAGSIVGGAASYLGSLMITRRMALVGDALGHVALPGMGLALLLRVDVSLGAFASLALGILLIWRLGEKTLLTTETLVGILFVSSLALGFLVVPQPELLESLIGDISRVSPPGVAASTLFSVLVVALVRRIYGGMMLLNISPDLAAVEGVEARKYNLVYLLAIAVMVSLGIKVTGSLLVGALLIIPPATARLLSADLKQYALTSAALGFLSGVAGVAASQALRFPPGPSIILVSLLFFTLALLGRRLGFLGRSCGQGR